MLFSKTVFVLHLVVVLVRIVHILNERNLQIRKIDVASTAGRQEFVRGHNWTQRVPKRLNRPRLRNSASETQNIFKIYEVAYYTAG